MSITLKKCLKCGRSPSTHPGTKLFNYPKPGIRNYLRCELWAKYCFPGNESSTQEFQHKLYNEHRVLCDKHFKRTSFFDHPNGTTKLSAYAIPVSDDEVLQSLDEPPVRNMKDISVSEKDLDTYHVTIKQEKAEINYDPHLVTIKKEPDDPENSNYVNDENVDIKPVNIKCEIKEEASAGLYSNELPQETSLDTGLKVDMDLGDNKEECEVKEAEEGRAEHKTEETSDEKKIHIYGVCNKQFSQIGTLNKHKLTHIGVKPYSCDICNKKFRERSTLNNHKLTHTGVKPYSCDICNNKFSQRGTLNKHKLTHTGVKPYSCDICNKQFRERGNLNNHKLTHSGVKPYSCDICHKKFSLRSHLNRHKRTHAGVKPYCCDICNKKFSESGSLNKHKLTHTGVKSYSCDICNKQFSRKDVLNIHKLTHTGVKPYSCDICNKKFRERGSLNRHKLRH